MILYTDILVFFHMMAYILNKHYILIYNTFFLDFFFFMKTLLRGFMCYKPIIQGSKRNGRWMEPHGGHGW